jgi:hypothetical protein
MGSIEHAAILARLEIMVLRLSVAAIALEDLAFIVKVSITIAITASFEHCGHGSPALLEPWQLGRKGSMPMH